MNRIVKLIKSSWATTREYFSSNTIAVGYYNIKNFGDQLTPDILAYFGIQTAHCPSFRFSTAIGVGSILHLLPKDYYGYILGSGLINDKTVRFPNSKALLVRGHLTRMNLGLPETTLIGDPGLISDEVYEAVVYRNHSWDVGVVPHYRDSHNDLLAQVLKKNNNLKVNIIDVRCSPKEVVREISNCKRVLSSSLHGLIVADSLGIPNAWIKLSNELIGRHFKFDDYYSCFEQERLPFNVKGNENLEYLLDACSLLPQDKVQKIKNNILLAFKIFKSQILDTKKQ